MSELEPKDSVTEQQGLEPHIAEATANALPPGPDLVVVNANGPPPGDIQDASSVSISSAVTQDGFNGNNNETNPATRGATSANKRSKRPPAKPSSALLEAKLNAQRKRNSAEKRDVAFIIKDHLQPARDCKEVRRKPTGVVYDFSMIQHKCLWDDSYPEKPERFSAVIQRCQELGLLERCVPIQPRLATKEEVLKIHPEEHIEKLKSVCDGADPTDPVVLEKLEEESSKYDAVYFHPSTYNLSLLSVGCTVDLVDSIVTGKVQNGMAIIRPPGHHAMKSEYCGYCYFNNVAIAAQVALDSGKASRILIVDFDAHHGQATQQAFYNDPRVLYFSTHRYEHGAFWPNLEESNYNFVGAGKGFGYNVNIPLNKTGLGNSEFIAIWHNILIPIACKFNPDLIIVSAGYDAALGCFEGEMEVTPQFYPHLLWPLQAFAHGKVAVVLEGGYCLQSLAEGAALTLRTLLGDPCPAVESTGESDSVLAEAVLNTAYMLQEHWYDLTSARFMLMDTELFKAEQAKGYVHLPSIKFEYNEPKLEKYPTRNCYPVQSEEVVRSLKERLDRLTLTTSLNKPSNKLCLVYNDVMLKHRNVPEPGHPEKPDRISNIFACHVDYGILERVLRLEGREATEEELKLVHTEEHIKLMKQTQSMPNKELYRLQEKFNSIYIHPNTYEAALFAAGSVLQVVDTVLNGSAQSGVAIVRPPGHHAEVDEACGFCFFNNVALAAKYALDMFDMKRILILDWDVHHGNGIQRIFESDPRVLYISLHRYDHGAFFPCSQDADYKFVGTGKGEGYSINIPWNCGGMGDTEYIAAFNKLIMPVAYQFNPELVLVSAGFDAAKGDPLGGCRVTPECYGHMTHMLSALANGKVIVALEGGYNLTSIAYSMVLCTKALLGDPLPPVAVKTDIHPIALRSIHDALRTHAKYWSTLTPFVKVLPLFEKRLIPVGNYPAAVTDVEVKEGPEIDMMATLQIKESNVINNNDQLDP